ncbi:hypothetical protein CSV61_10250 [Sporosarcina sp. P3]|nr:hypothetical protein CSV61_10250 [Sporosarcina sp. P3]
MKLTPRLHYTLFIPWQYSRNYEMLKNILNSSGKKGILKKEWKVWKGWMACSAVLAVYLPGFI